MAEANMTIITMQEIDGSILRVPAYEAVEGFLHLDTTAIKVCEEAGYMIYKDQQGNYYLVDRDKKILAKNMHTIRMYIKYMV